MLIDGIEVTTGQTLSIRAMKCVLRKKKKGLRRGNRKLYMLVTPKATGTYTIAKIGSRTEPYVMIRS